MPRLLPRVVAAVSLWLLATAAAALAQTPDPILKLPTHDVPGIQIGWFRNQTFDAFVKAVETERPLVLILGEPDGLWSGRLVTLVLPCPQINRLAGLGVFAVAYPSRDERARLLASALKVTSYPSLRVIEPRTDSVVERFSMEGFFDAETMARDLLAYIASPASAPPPLPVPKPYETFGHLACTPAAARRLGVSAPPGR